MRLRLHAAWPAAALVAAFALTAAPARATISREAEPVLRRYLQVIGVTDSTPPENTGHAKCTIRALRMRGTLEVWWQEPGRFASITRLGSMTTRDGFDGETAWRTNSSSGEVARLDGQELERVKADGYFRSDAWMLPDQGGGRVGYQGKVFNEEGAFHVLQITPPAGKPRRFWFGAKSGLLVRMVEKDDQYHVETRFSAYKEIAGRLRPTVVSGAGPSEGSGGDRMTLDSLWVNVPVDPALFRLPGAQGTPVRWLKTPGVAQVPFLYGRKHIWVKVSINGGAPVDFLLDTGASTTVVDSLYAVKRGLRLEGAAVGQGVGALGTMSFSGVRSLSLSGPDGQGVSVRDLKVAVIHFGEDMEQALWRRPYGLLGFDFVSRFVTEVDFDRGRLTFHDPDRFEYAGLGTPIPMRLAGNIPTVTMKVDGRCEGEFRVDVGNSFTVNIAGPLTRRCGLVSRAREKREVWGAGFGGAVMSTLGRLSRFEIGPYGWDEPLATFSLGQYGLLASEQYAGLIGNGVLERFKCTFDYRRRMLYLEPGTRYPQRDVWTRLGTDFIRLDTRVVLGQVDRHSPADEAGLEPEDEVLAINGRPAMALTPEELDRLFVDGAAGARHEIQVRRDGTARRVEVTLTETK